MGIHVSTKSASGTSLELSKSIKIWKRFGFWNKVATHVVTQVSKDIVISYALKQGHLVCHLEEGRWHLKQGHWHLVDIN